MPVWPRAMLQLIHAMDWTLPEVVGEDWYDTGKCTEAVWWGLCHLDYDVVLPAYTDNTFGLPAAGGRIAFSKEVGRNVAILTEKPVRIRSDWPRVQRRLARASVISSDPRMAGALDTIRNVSRLADGRVPLVATGYSAATAAMLLFRPTDAFIRDMLSDPQWTHEMIRVAMEWTLDWIRAQYDAGANSVTFLSDTLGTFLISPLMGERFTLPYLCRMAERIRSEFGQGVWLHIHGSVKTAMGSRYLERIVKEAGIEGLHVDDAHSPRFIKENIIDGLGIPACIVVDCHKIATGPESEIEAMVRNALSVLGDGLGAMMAPCCQVLPHTPNTYFKAWVDATHRWGAYPFETVAGTEVHSPG